jgi:hypothetical protein
MSILLKKIAPIGIKAYINDYILKTVRGALLLGLFLAPATGIRTSFELCSSKPIVRHTPSQKVPIAFAMGAGSLRKLTLKSLRGAKHP